jgi:DNA polymerase-1
MQTPLKIFVVDGSSFLYRAYYGMRPLQTSQGVPVQAVYSFCKMIRKLIKDFSIKHLVIVWDSKGKNIRHEIYPEYKATRQQAPSDLFTQKDLILEFLDLVKIEQLAQIGIEADDLIASLAHKFVNQGHEVVIVSSDKDLAQIVTTEKIEIFDPFKEIILTQDKLTELYGFPLTKLPFYFALLGDASDNIPGVKGIGKKGATDLVVQFKNLDDLYANIKLITKRRTQELLLEQKDNAYLSLQLFTLQDYPTATDAVSSQFNVENWDLAIPFLQKLEFKSLIIDIEKKSTQTPKSDPAQTTIFHQPSENLHDKYRFICINNLSDLVELCNKIKTAKICALDTETSGLDPMLFPCVGISIAVEHGTAYYLPFGHKTSSEQLSKRDIINHLQPIFSNPEIKKILHHAKFDQVVLHQMGLSIDNIFFDTLIAASLVLPETIKKGLKNLSELYLNEPMISYEDVIKQTGSTDFANVPIDLATNYAAADAHQTLQVYFVLEQELIKHNVDKLFYTLEMPINDILVAMQIEGILCDKKVLEDLDLLVSRDIDKIAAQIHAFTSEPINLNSPKQVKELLFEKLNLPPQKKNAKSKELSTDAQVLEKLSEIHPVPKLLLEYRELFKLKSTYIESLPTFINPHTGKIHTSFNQTLVATGRLSSSNPNLQNIPTGNLGYNTDIRSAFYAPAEHLFLAADYSQIELRILAFLSQDQHLINSFLHNEDIHAQTAAKIFNTTPEQIISAQRNIGKIINFSVLYGLTPYGLSKDLHISYKQAEQYINNYFAQYPSVTTWMNNVIKSTQELGYTQTFFQRKRWVPQIHEKNKTLFDLGKRIAINTVVQGTAAEIMKLGMLNVAKTLVENNLQRKILLQIHDELILSVPASELEITKNSVQQALESVVAWNVPLTVQIKTGKTWHDVTK